MAGSQVSTRQPDHFHCNPCKRPSPARYVELERCCLGYRRKNLLVWRRCEAATCSTPPQRNCFDQTARLAAFFCGTPIGLIGFIDATRLWFKARVGWDYPQIPREDSICHHTIVQPELVVYSDAAMDARFFNGPIVTHAGIRFYAGAPLLTREGYAVGTLCVMDRLPRELPPAHKDALHILARLVSAQLEVRRGTRPSAHDDKSSRIEGTVVDISQHKRTDEALRDSQERLLGIISSAMDAIITVDGDQKIIVFNRAAEQIFRCPAKDALGQTLDKFIPQRFREAHGGTFGASGKLVFPVALCTRRARSWGSEPMGRNFQSRRRSRK